MNLFFSCFSLILVSRRALSLLSSGGWCRSSSFCLSSVSNMLVSWSHSSSWPAFWQKICGCNRLKVTTVTLINVRCTQRVRILVLTPDGMLTHKFTLTILPGCSQDVCCFNELLWLRSFTGTKWYQMRFRSDYSIAESIELPFTGYMPSAFVIYTHKCCQTQNSSKSKKMNLKLQQGDRSYRLQNCRQHFPCPLNTSRKVASFFHKIPTEL